MDAGRLIKLLRTAGEITQGELAKELGVTQTYLSRVENGRREPGMNLIRKASHRFGVPMALFLLHEGPDHEVIGELGKILQDVLHAKIMSRTENGAGQITEGPGSENGRPPVSPA